MLYLEYALRAKIFALRAVFGICATRGGFSHASRVTAEDAARSGDLSVGASRDNLCATREYFMHFVRFLDLCGV